MLYCSRSYLRHTRLTDYSCLIGPTKFSTRVIIGSTLISRVKPARAYVLRVVLEYLVSGYVYLVLGIHIRIHVLQL
jgi:hypothetical protein